MLQVVNVTIVLDPLMATPPPCEQSDNRQSNGAMDNRQHLFIGRARTPDAVFEWMSQLLKVTVPLSMKTPPPCEQSSGCKSNGAMDNRQKSCSTDVCNLLTVQTRVDKERSGKGLPTW